MPPLMDAIEGLCKAELLYKRRLCKTQKLVESATLEWVWGSKNRHRRLELAG